MSQLAPLSATAFATAKQADSLHFARPSGRLRAFGSGAVPLVTLAFDTTAAGAWVRADTAHTIYQIETYQLNELLPERKAIEAKAVHAR